MPFQIVLLQICAIEVFILQVVLKISLFTFSPLSGRLCFQALCNKTSIPHAASFNVKALLPLKHWFCSPLVNLVILCVMWLHKPGRRKTIQLLPVSGYACLWNPAPWCRIPKPFRPWEKYAYTFFWLTTSSGPTLQLPDEDTLRWLSQPLGACWSLPVVSGSLWPYELPSTGSSVDGLLQARVLERVPGPISHWLPSSLLNIMHLCSVWSPDPQNQYT